MRFIVPPQLEEQQNKKGGPPVVPDPPICIPLYHTMCALCSEDPRFCDDVM